MITEESILERFESYWGKKSPPFSPLTSSERTTLKIFLSWLLTSSIFEQDVREIWQAKKAGQ